MGSRAGARGASLPAGPERVVRVLPEAGALDRAFSYTVPGAMAPEVRLGTRVRVMLAGRSLPGWVVGEDAEPPPGVALRPIAGTRGCGPPPSLVALAEWAAWRWSGRLARFLRTASPPSIVRFLPPTPSPKDSLPPSPPGPLAAAALGQQRSVLRLAPAADPFALLDAATRRIGPGVLVLAPSHAGAAAVAASLRRAGRPVALLPGDWARAAAGGCVAVGTRSAAWAPLEGLSAAVVLDAHDQAYREERAPTWNAWVVVAERAARQGAPCVAVSPCPTPELLAWGRLVTTSRSEERSGWPVLEVVDRRGDDPRSGLFSSRLVRLLAEGEPGRPVVCLLNRRGRARLLACVACGELVRCERCGGSSTQEGEGPGLSCRRCGESRPPLCAACGSQHLAVLRPGVTKVAEEIAALCGRPVATVSGPGARAPAGAGPRTAGGCIDAPVVVGTEAVLHRVARAEAVAFMDMDQELMAPTFRAGERAMALLCRAACLVGGRRQPSGAGRGAGGRLLVQTRLPGHEVLDAALHADPGRMAAAEAPVRRELGLPPWRAVAAVSGESATAFTERLGASGATGVEVLGPREGAWLVRAGDHQTLCDALAGVERPPGRLRVEVDPENL